MTPGEFVLLGAIAVILAVAVPLAALWLADDRSLSFKPPGGEVV